MKGISSWIWVIGGIIISMVLATLFFNFISKVTIEKHKQVSKESFSMMVNNINSLCDMNEGQSMSRTITFSGLTSEVYTTNEGKIIITDGKTTGTYLCINITNQLICEKLGCSVEMSYIIQEEDVLGLVDRLLGKISYDDYQLEFYRLGCGGVTCCGVDCINAIDEFSDGDLSKMIAWDSNLVPKITIPKGSTVRSAKLDITSESLGEEDVELVFVADTSGSMTNEWTILCDIMEGVVSAIEEKGIGVDYKIYALNHEMGDCTNEVLNMDEEHWGPGAEYVARNHPWKNNVRKIIFPISDEGSYEGDDVNQEDWDAINTAISATNENDITVYGLWGDGSSDEVIELMRSISEGTGGIATYFGSADEVANTIITAVFRCPYKTELDIGNDGNIEWAGFPFGGVTLTDLNTDPKLTTELTDLLEECNCLGCNLSENECTIDFNFLLGVNCTVIVNRLCICAGSCNTRPCVRVEHYD